MYILGEDNQKGIIRLNEQISVVRIYTELQ